MASGSKATTGKPPVRPPALQSGKGRRSAARSSEVGRNGQLRTERSQRARRRQLWLRTVVAVLAGGVVLLVVFLTGGNRGAASYPYQVGQPGVGAIAPMFQLQSTAGGTFSVAAAHGKTMLLYFQEGTDCEPCWTQLHDIQRDMAKFRAAGVDQVVSITTDSLGALRQKASDEGIQIPVLSDLNLAVSHVYHANQYGMMGTMMDGHSFVLIGPNGTVEWRADYGGPPNYTMFVPDRTLLDQMRAGMAHPSGVSG